MNVYDVQWKIGGNYYAGPQADSTLAVYDPSLGSVVALGMVLHGCVTGDFAMGAAYLNSKIIAGLVYTEHRTTGNVIVTSTTPISLSIVGGKTAIVLSGAARNGVGNYSMQVILGDDTGPGNTDLIGLQVKDPTGAVVPDLTFTPMAIETGNIEVLH